MISAAGGRLSLMDAGATTPVTVDATRLNPNLVTVELLAQLALKARREGRGVVLRDACDALLDLIELAGLAEVIRCADGKAAASCGSRSGGAPGDDRRS